MSKDYNLRATEYDENVINEYKVALRKYWLQCLLTEGSKILIFFIIFNYLHLTQQFLIALLVLMLVRSNGGGLHCNHYLSCFLLSLAVLISCIYCGTYFNLSKNIAIPILLFCSVIGYFLVPIVSRNRPEPDKKLIRQSKLCTVAIIVVYCFLICMNPYNQYINIGTWTIIIHILQLILAKIIKRRQSYV